MKFFSKQELIAIIIILGLVSLVSFRNFQISLRRGRDAQRKTDITGLAKALDFYHQDFGFYPPSTKDGRIVACGDETATVNLEMLEEQDLSLEDKLLEVFEPCDWAEDAIRDVSDPNYPPYYAKLPADPIRKTGHEYRYISNTNRFQLYATLEGDDEAEYDEEIIDRGIMCGTAVCNYGRASGQTPLEISIEEYENELLIQDEK